LGFPNREEAQPIRIASVVALADEALGVKVKAHLSIRGEKRPSLIELKTFCSQHLPLYLVPDAFVFHDLLPRMSNDKIDYQSLKNLA
jgi:non-ribosomal peptide synthetase component E (peptide arylation enzyme)